MFLPKGPLKGDYTAIRHTQTQDRSRATLRIPAERLPYQAVQLPPIHIPPPTGRPQAYFSIRCFQYRAGMQRRCKRGLVRPVMAMLRK